MIECESMPIIFFVGCVSFEPDNPDYVPSRHKGYNVGCWSNCLCRQARLERGKSRRIKKMEEEDKLSAAASLLCLSSSVSNVELQQQSEEEDYFAETESNTTGKLAKVCRLCGQTFWTSILKWTGW